METEAYCDQQDRIILEDIINENVPRTVLVGKSGWKRVCQVRGRNLSKVDPASWQRLCAQRGEAGPPPGPYT